MPKIEDTIKKIDIILPSNKEVKLTIRKGMSVGDLEEVNIEEDDFKRSIIMLEKMIVSWNFTDKDENPLPIVYDNIRKLNISDMNFIIKSADIKNGFLEQKQEEK